MTLNLGSLTTHYMESLHEFIDWTTRWGSPRTAREDAIFFETQGKIVNGEIPLKPFVHRLRSTLEAFFDDYRKEPNAKERVGNEFLERASVTLEQAEAFQQSASEEEKPLNAELIKLLKASISNIDH